IVTLDLLGLGKKTGTDEILGYKCDVYEFGVKPTDENYMEAIQGGIDPPYFRKTWIWKEANIPLRVVTEQFSSVSELVATKIDVDENIPEAQFNIPDGIKITYDKKMSESLKQEALARFMLYKTGKPMTLRVKVEEQPVISHTKDVSRPTEGRKMPETANTGDQDRTNDKSRNGDEKTGMN
ncbi:MAG TPA: hypothetical protein VHC46_08840, partial [Thermodesulfobacteriota bacterium]|nr:hypothetical protein [Thermodesulfobacteriota bacterium]